MKNKIALLVLMILGVSATSFALDTDLFRPVGDNNGTFRLDGSRTLRPLDISLGTFISYSHNPLVMSGFAVAPEKRSIVERQFTLNFLGDIGVHDRVSLGFAVPVMASKHVDLATVTTYNNYWSVGDIEFHGKVRILKAEDFPVGLSVVPFAQVQTGKPEHFTGDQSFDFGAKAVVDWEYGRFYLTSNIGYKGHYKQDTVEVVGTNAILRVDDEFTYGVGGRFDIIKDRLQFVTDIAGSTVIKDFFEYERSSPLEFLGGVRAFFKDQLIGLHLGGGTGLTDGYGSPRYRVFGGVTVKFGIPRGGERKGAAVVGKNREIEQVIVLRDVFFDTASSELKSESFAVLDDNVTMLKKNQDVSVRIEGHCDSRGSEGFNQKLSEKRADSVMKYFVSKGISKDRLSAIGMGETKPLEPNDSISNMDKNRRIELHLIRYLNSAR